MHQIDKTKQVRLANRPLCLSIQENNMRNSDSSTFLIVPQFSTYQTTFIDSITHLASSTCYAPVFLDLPYHSRICQAWNRAIQVSCRNMQSLLTAPNTSRLWIWIEINFSRIAHSFCDCSYRCNQCLRRLMMILIASSGCTCFYTQFSTKIQSLFLSTQQRENPAEFILAKRKVLRQKIDVFFLNTKLSSVAYAHPVFAPQLIQPFFPFSFRT